MKVEVDEDLCQGHTLCNMIAPEVFDLSDQDGHALVTMPSIPDSLKDKTRRASLNCPELAIRLIEDTN